MKNPIDNDPGEPAPASGLYLQIDGEFIFAKPSGI
jgi:hypothetical protein